MNVRCASCNAPVVSLVLVPFGLDGTLQTKVQPCGHRAGVVFDFTDEPPETL